MLQLFYLERKPTLRAGFSRAVVFGAAVFAYVDQLSNLVLGEHGLLPFPRSFRVVIHELIRHLTFDTLACVGLVDGTAISAELHVVGICWLKYDIGIFRRGLLMS